MRVRFTETAYGELGDIHSFLVQLNPIAARAAVARIESTARQIGMFPYMGRVKYRQNVRMFPVRRFPYLIFYTIEADEVVILSIRHAARRRPPETEA
jgi:plasmid stabilization system protein ParE